MAQNLFKLDYLDKNFRSLWIVIFDNAETVFQKRYKVYNCMAK